MTRATAAMRARTVEGNPTALREALLGWYDAHVRPLPWRADRDPYRVWVAEVMLQQTRVDVVIPKYQRFMRRFPDVASLARASEERVLAAWSGLGYYTRARSLHRAARALRAAGLATFPRDASVAAKLPGVGSYTLGAVLSIAYDLPYSALDANVVRVLSRLACLERPDARGEPHASLAERLLDRSRPGDWNQALMELGETVCLPRAPRCDACPSSGTCAGTFRHAILHRQLAVEVFVRTLRSADSVDRTTARTPAPRRSSRANASAAERRTFSRAAYARLGKSSLLTKALALALRTHER